ncbi:MAG: hypothetical protein ACQZ3M_08365, partial [cyanobacterium endosymbiont of Rhopalodia fuxianensis]
LNSEKHHFSVRWLSVHLLDVSAVFFIGGISAIRFAQLNDKRNLWKATIIPIVNLLNLTRSGIPLFRITFSCYL